MAKDKIILAKDAEGHITAVRAATALSEGECEQLVWLVRENAAYIQCLELPNCLITNYIMVLLAGAEAYPTLTTLNLSGSVLTNCTAFLQLLPIKSPALQELYLHNVGLDEMGTACVIAALWHCNTLTTLDLSNNGLCYKGALALGEMLVALPALQKLALNACHISPAALPALCNGLRTLQSLTAIELGSNALDDVAITAVAAALKSRQLIALDLSYNLLTQAAVPTIEGLIGAQLECLRISGNALAGPGAIMLANVLASCSKLRELYLADDYGVAGLDVILSCITVSQLEVLDLVNCPLRSNAKALASMLQEAVNLRRLNLNGCKIGSEAAILMAPALRKCQKLESIALHDNNLTDAGAAPLVVALSLIPTLQVLILSNNKLSGQNFSLLRGNIALRKLAVASNRIGPTGVKALAAILPHCKLLKELDIGDNAIGPLGAAAIARAVFKGIKIELRHNKIGEAGVLAIAAIINAEPSATQLELQGNGLSGICLQVLIAAIIKLPSLVRLDLSMNMLTDADIRPLWVLQKHSKLLELNLAYNQIGPAGAAALVEHLPPQLKLLTITGNQIGVDGEAALAYEARTRCAHLVTDASGVTYTPPSCTPIEASTEEERGWALV